MVGAGAIAGTISGCYTNAARSPGRPAADIAVSEAVAQDFHAPAEYTDSNTSTVAMTGGRVALAAVRNEAPAAVIAMRFPSQWQKQAPRASNGDNDPPQQTMAYAAEPQAPEPVRPATASAAGFALASVDTNANPEPVPVPMPKRMARPEKPKPPVLFNDAQLASIKARLRLTRDQEAYWPQVESALRAISWKLATQQKGIVGRNQAQMIDPSSPEVARLKSAAFPLIMSMREDQKQEVRQLAHTMGLKQVASMF